MPPAHGGARENEPVRSPILLGENRERTGAVAQTRLSLLALSARADLDLPGPGGLGLGEP